MEQTKSYITYSMSIPEDVNTSMELSDMIRKRTGKDDITPWQKMVNYKYASIIRDCAMLKFMSESHKHPYADHVKYSHAIRLNHDTRQLECVRFNTENPDIFDKFQNNFNINL